MFCRSLKCACSGLIKLWSKQPLWLSTTLNKTRHGTTHACMGVSQYDMQYNSLPKGVSVISDKTRKSLENLEVVEAVALYRSRSYADGVYYQNTAFSGNVFGVNNDYFSVNDYAVVYGRTFTD